MANCQGCGAPVTWAVVEETEERVPLDNALSDQGEGRYRIVGSTVEGERSIQIIEPVPKEHGAMVLQDHRRVCVSGRVNPA